MDSADITPADLEDAALALVANAVLAVHNEGGVDEVMVEASRELVALGIAEATVNGRLKQEVTDAFVEAVAARNLMAALHRAREIVAEMNRAMRTAPTGERHGRPLGAN